MPESEFRYIKNGRPGCQHIEVARVRHGKKHWLGIGTVRQLGNVYHGSPAHADLKLTNTSLDGLSRDLERIYFADRPEVSRG